MNGSEIQKYIDYFNQKFPLLVNNTSVWYIELTEEDLRNNQQLFADKVLSDNCYDSDVFGMGALIFYGYRLGVYRLKGKNDCYTRQDGYRDNAIRNYNFDEILNEETNEKNQETSTSHIINWIINPGGNIDVADTIISKMIVPLVNTLCKITPPGKKMDCTIVLPPISEDIEDLDWNEIFEDLKYDNLRINIESYGYLLNIDKDNRQYIIQYQTDGYQDYIIVSAYELFRGHNKCVGCIAFDVNDMDCQYILKDIQNQSIDISNRRTLPKDKKTIQNETKFDWEYLQCKYPVSEGFNSFLGNHEATFGDEIYKISREYNKNTISEIETAFQGEEAIQVKEICASILGEENLYNISLGDLVYVANYLEKNKWFKCVSIGTIKDYKLGSHKVLDSAIDVSNLQGIPSNYNSITWKLKDSRKKTIDIFKLDTEKHKIAQIIESIVRHFDHCTTEMLADELLYIYKAGVNASAFFVAKVFLYISGMDSLIIDSRNEFVQKIEIVDDVEYEELDKSQIFINQETKKQQSGIKIFKQGRKDKNLNEMFLDDLELSVRTKNCLNREGIITLGDLIKKSRSDILKIRNMDKRGMEEIDIKLKKLGLSYKG